VLGAVFLHAAVNLYFRPAVLEGDVARLREAGYHVVRADASAWRNVADMHRSLSTVFAFPAHYGQNWAAFNDCLGDVFDRDDPARIVSAAAAGLVLVLTGFDAFAGKFAGEAHILLDICAIRQRAALVDGHHLICLVQSNDPDLMLAPVGATAPQWNRAEWLNRDRQR
jgi:hypothetical protein